MTVTCHFSATHFLEEKIIPKSIFVLFFAVGCVRWLRHVYFGAFFSTVLFHLVN